MVLCALLCGVGGLYFPTNEELHDRIPQPMERTSQVGESVFSKPHPHGLGMFACLLIISMRTFAIASLEAATAMILEDKFAFGERSVGFLLGISFFTTVPMKLAFDRVKEASTRAIHVRLLMLLAVLGAVLLREDVGQVLACGSTKGRVVVIVLAGMLLFPAMFLTGAVIEGVGFWLASPEGTTFSMNNFNLSIIFMATTVARSLGPPLARMTLTYPSGQTLYAWQQLAISSVGLLLVETIIVEKLNAMDANAKYKIVPTPSKDQEEARICIPKEGQAEEEGNA
jgi:hypothetical protein